MRKILLLLLFITSGLVTSAQVETYSRVRIQLGSAEMLPLQKIGLAIDHHEQVGANEISAELSTSELSRMRAAGISYTVQVPDLQRHYRERAAEDIRLNPNPLQSARQQPIPCPVPPDPNDTITVPAGFTLGSMGGFFTYQELLGHLDTLAARFPNLITVKAPIGTFQTHEGRQLFYVKVSDNPGQDESATEPQVMYSALHHAREPQSVSQLIFYLYYILENYGTNPLATHIIQNTEMFFVPCINPDGYVFNETFSPNGGGMWRKNRRNNNDGTMGVDLNRNYGYQWGFDDVGSGPDTWQETYRGPSAFSEPETQAMKWFTEQHQFKNALNYHAYSNVFIYPWGAVPDFYTPDSARYTRYGELMTRDNNFGYGTCNQVLGYMTNGSSDDWMYGEQTTKPKIMAATPEIGTADDGFWPVPSRIIPLCKKTFATNLSLALLAGPMVQAKLERYDIVNTTAAQLQFELTSIGLVVPSNATVTLSSNSPYLTSVGAPFVVSSLQDLAPVNGVLSYQLSPATPLNTPIELLLTVSYGGQSFSQNVTRVYNSVIPVQTSYFNTLTNWTGTWGLTTSEYHSAPSSITDSPNGNYGNGVVEPLFLTPAINLTNATAAYAQFWAKWDIEKVFYTQADYVQVRAVAPGINQPLCGHYTVPSKGFQPAQDEPLYEGLQTEWVHETLDLSEFLGQTIHLRFELGSDGSETRDGFYLDDFEVIVVDPSTIGVAESISGASAQLGTARPNPTSGVTAISYQLPAQEGMAQLLVTDVLGRTMSLLSVEGVKGELQLNVANWPAGVYTYRLITASGTSATRRLVVE